MPYTRWKKAGDRVSSVVASLRNDVSAWLIVASRTKKLVGARCVPRPRGTPAFGVTFARSSSIPRTWATSLCRPWKVAARDCRSLSRCTRAFDWPSATRPSAATTTSRAAMTKKPTSSFVRTLTGAWATARTIGSTARPKTERRLATGDSVIAPDPIVMTASMFTPSATGVHGTVGARRADGNQAAGAIGAQAGRAPPRVLASLDASCCRPP